MYLADCTIRGKHRLDLLGVVDSGSSITHVTTDARKRAGLEPTGYSQKFLCVHGQNHAGIEPKSHHGVITIGTVSGDGTACELDASPAVGGLRIGAVLGRDVLQHFNVDLHWRDGTGLLG